MLLIFASKFDSRILGLFAQTNLAPLLIFLAVGIFLPNELFILNYSPLLLVLPAILLWSFSEISRRDISVFFRGFFLNGDAASRAIGAYLWANSIDINDLAQDRIVMQFMTIILLFPSLNNLKISLQPRFDEKNFTQQNVKRAILFSTSTVFFLLAVTAVFQTVGIVHVQVDTLLFLAIIATNICAGPSSMYARKTGFEGYIRQINIPIIIVVFLLPFKIDTFFLLLCITGYNAFRNILLIRKVYDHV